MILQNVELFTTSRSYVNCLHSLLSNSSLFDEPIYMLSGMTGMAFKFIIHKQILPSSLDMYDWLRENKRSVNNLGIYNEIHGGRNDLEVFVLYQKESIMKTKTSIDNGMCVIAWGIENSCFSLIYGYDDEDEVFYFINGNSGKKNVILYENYCNVSEGGWYYQIFGDKVKRDIKDIYTDSLLIAISEWEQEYKVGSATHYQYASGKKAYEYLINALKKGDIKSIGPYYVIRSYIRSKTEIRQYMKEVIKELPQHNPVYECYYQVNELFQSIKHINFSGDVKKDKIYFSLLIDIFTKSFEYEKVAIELLKQNYHERIHNRTINLNKIEIL